MVIASIDVQNGKVVQLKQGSELVLEREDAAALAGEFNVFGKVALIDLDAAMGRGSNARLVKGLLRKAQCRVGGGIRTVAGAVELISLGAEKVIVGSMAFRTHEGFGINSAFLEELAAKIGRNRLIIAVDSRNDVIVVDGWKTSTGLNLARTARELERYAAEFLWTCVEREGTMTGISFPCLRALKESTSAKITAAGGVSSLEEIEKLAGFDCDVQLGMALYKGIIKLDEAFVCSLDWEKSGDGLLPVIAQSPDGQVLMTGFTDREALRETFRRRRLCFYSRTRKKLWMKGESSGNVLKLLKLRADCDRDALLAAVEPAGPVCHTGDWSCFETGRQYSLSFLQEVIEERIRMSPDCSYTASLSVEKVKRKVMEEAYEICTARDRAESVWEAADLFFHIMLLLTKEGIGLKEVLEELDRRHKEDAANKKRFETGTDG